MGTNLISGCHHCKVSVFHVRGDEQKTIGLFYQKHMACIRKNKTNVETKEDQLQEEPWMREYADESYDATLSAKFQELVKLNRTTMERLGWVKYEDGGTYSEWQKGAYRFHLRHDGGKNNFGIQVAGSSSKNIVYFNWRTTTVPQMQSLWHELTGEVLPLIF